MRAVLDRVSPDLSWKEVEDGIEAISQVEVTTPREEDVEAPKVEDHAPVAGDLES